MTSLPYIYRVVEVVKVTDGDTYWLRVDVGFRQDMLINVRLLGYDTPELHKGSDFEKTVGLQAAATVLGFLTEYDSELWVRTEKDPDDFGRWLGDVWAETIEGREIHLGPMLAEMKLATHWPTRWHEVYEQ